MRSLIILSIAALTLGAGHAKAATEVTYGFQVIDLFSFPDPEVGGATQSPTHVFNGEIDFNIADGAVGSDADLGLGANVFFEISDIVLTLTGVNDPGLIITAEVDASANIVFADLIDFGVGAFIDVNAFGGPTFEVTGVTDLSDYPVGPNANVDDVLDITFVGASIFDFASGAPLNLMAGAPAPLSETPIALGDPGGSPQIMIRADYLQSETGILFEDQAFTVLEIANSTYTARSSLAAVPVPAALPLLIGALGALVLVGRRKAG